MYYLTEFTTTSRFFQTHAEGLQKLLAFKLLFERKNCTLLDYLLLPHSFNALVFCPSDFQLEGERGLSNSIKPVSQCMTLPIFAFLAHEGPSYPLCGTYELYHGSQCFCELGKYPAANIPFSLKLILQAKEH